MSNLSTDILGVGAPILDHLFFVSEAYLEQIPGQKYGMELVSYEEMATLIEKSGSTPKHIVGGSCANAMRGLSSLGWQCALAGKVGKDAVGKKVVEDLNNFHITPLFSLSEIPTSHVACLISSQGKRTCRCYLGASKEMGPSDLKPEFFQKVKLVHIEGYSLLTPGLTEQAMKYAKEAKALISFDMGSFEMVQDHRQELLHLIPKFVDILFANEDEARMMAGNDEKNPKEICKSLQELCPVAIVMIGNKGCWVGNQGKVFHTPASVVETIDTTGAGDLFASGFLHGYLKNKTLQECARYGTITGAAAVQVIGAEIPAEKWPFIYTQIT